MEIIKHPIENIFAVHLGTKDEMQEISLCRKEKDKDGNTYYIDLLTNNTYPTSTTNENEVIALKEYTLLGMLRNTDYRDKILENKYLTNQDLLILYDHLNEDTKYPAYEGSDHLLHPHYFWAIVTWNLPMIFSLDEDQTFINLVAALKANNKITVITGAKGIGKSFLKNKFANFYEKSEDYFNNAKLYQIDFNEMLKNTFTTKHVLNRIKKTIEEADYNKRVKPIIFIDNVDFSNKYFIENLRKENQGINIPLVLISDKELSDDALDENFFTIVRVKKDPKEILTQILHHCFDKNSKQNKKEGTPLLCIHNISDIIEILLACDQSHYMNKVDNTQNPKLGITIIENAFQVASITNSPSLSHTHFIKALDFGNIDMDKTTKEKTIKAFEELERKRLEQSRNETKRETWKDYLKEKNESLPLLTDYDIITHSLLICDKGYNSNGLSLGINIIDKAYNIAFETRSNKVGAVHFIEALNHIEINQASQKEAIAVLDECRIKEEKELFQIDSPQKKKRFGVFQKNKKTE